MSGPDGDIVCIIEPMLGEGDRFDLKASVTPVPINLDSVDDLQQVGFGSCSACIV
jgi:hypothetical protein